MRRILVDVGPLIALFDRTYAHRTAVREFIRETQAQLVSTWPVVTEVSHILDFDLRTQMDFVRWIAGVGVTLYDIDAQSLHRIIELKAKYQDRPMEVADASLVVTAERLKVADIISIDRDFDIYRTVDGKTIRNVYMEPG